jgi:hypothetical protein
MKKIKTKCVWCYSKVLAAVLAMLGVVSCSKEDQAMYGPPVMYGVPDTLSTDTSRLMNRVPSATFLEMETEEPKVNTEQE